VGGSLDGEIVVGGHGVHCPPHKAGVASFALGGEVFWRGVGLA